jgi:hypothetical protein
MIDHQLNSANQPNTVTDGAALSTAEISQLLLASSLSATRPLLGLIKLLTKEGILDGGKLKAFLERELVTDTLPVATKAMLDPMWKSFLAQIPASTETPRPARRGTRR